MIELNSKSPCHHNKDPADHDVSGRSSTCRNVRTMVGYRSITKCDNTKNKRMYRIWHLTVTVIAVGGVSE